MNQPSADHAAVRIHPPILLLVHLLVAFLLNRFVPLPIPVPGVLVGIGYALVLTGIGLAASAASQFMQAQTTLDPHGSVSHLVTQGPYRFSRNPIYLGFICLLIGFLFIFKSYWGMILSPVLMLSLNQWVIRFEERYLEAKFGDRYTSYKDRVRRWL
jgi:protein-S-isoprenylcysteine O-methyltransferase Ste14